LNGGNKEISAPNLMNQHQGLPDRLPFTEEINLTIKVMQLFLQ
jgi:hypothetical protein